MAFIPSEQQQAIFDKVLATHHLPGRKALAVSALAGTGKTTTAVELIRRIPGCDGIYCAFNKPIAAEAKTKLTGTKVDAKTFHSMGYGVLLQHLKQQHGVKQFKTEENKYKDIVTRVVIDASDLQTVIRDAAEAQLKADYGDMGLPPFEVEKMVQEIVKVVVQFLKELARFARLKLAEWDDLTALRRLASRVADDELLTDAIINASLPLVKSIMEEAEEATNAGLIDFTDMIYWCVRWNLALPKYKWIFVDEAQDLSPMQREMVYRSAADTSFTIIIGDENQAIYHFAGADSDSWKLTVDKFKADALPLSVTRRCAAIITQHAQTIVPQFRALPDAPRGKIVWWAEDRLHEVAQPGDLVVCRLKAPVVGACLGLIAKNIPATVLGSDIGKALVGILEKVQKRRGFTFEQATKHLTDYGWAERAKWLKKGDERRAEAVKDEADALIFIIEEMQPKPTSIEDVSDFIKTLFADGDKDSMVTFATGHKSKGLEAKRVFILAPERMPLRYKGMTDEDLQQEDNLHYVAITRAIETLVFLTNDTFLEKMKKQQRPPYIQMDFADHNWNDPVGQPPDLPISIPGEFDSDDDDEFEEDDIWHDADDTGDDDLSPAAAVAFAKAESVETSPAPAPEEAPEPIIAAVEPVVPASAELDDETADALVIDPDAADVAEAAPVSPIGEKLPDAAPVIEKPATPPVLMKLKDHRLDEEDEPKFTATGKLDKDMQAFAATTREGLAARLRRLPTKEAILMRELLDELIAERLLTQAEVVNA
jgi:superfamily I DNA/RNA helicase